MQSAQQILTTTYSKLEEWLHSISHGVGFGLAIAALVVMLYEADSTVAITASAIYGSSLILMFLCSTIYHAVTHHQVKTLLKLFDHSSIYLLIAGTYTPFLLVSLGGWLGWSVFILIWSLAVFGVVFKCFVRHRFAKLSVATYLVMGWLALVIIYPLYLALPGAGLWLLIAGGLCFSVGVAFYVAKHLRFTHFVWHLFVLAGCACHFFAVYYFVL